MPPFTHIDPVRFDVDAPGSTDLIEDLVNNDEYLFAAIGSVDNGGGAPLVQNGSFELDPPATVNPTGWIFTPQTGGAGVVSGANPSHGIQHYRVTQDTTVGHGGGAIVNDSFFDVSDKRQYSLKWQWMSDQANVRSIAQITYYDKTLGTPISTITLLDVNGSFPTSYKLNEAIVTPPATAVAAKFTFTLGDSAKTPAATAHIDLDDLSMIERPPFSSAVAVTASGNFTVPQGVTRLWCQLVGGGASGGANPGGQGAGGGAAGYCEGYLTVKPGDIIAAVIGAGGASVSSGNGVAGTATTFSTLTANGGGANTTITGGAGGTASGGSINLTGQAGRNGVAGGAQPLFVGGNSPLLGRGGGGQAGNGSQVINSQAGINGILIIRY